MNSQLFSGGGIILVNTMYRQLRKFTLTLTPWKGSSLPYSFLHPSTKMSGNILTPWIVLLTNPSYAQLAPGCHQRCSPATTQRIWFLPVSPLYLLFFVTVFFQLLFMISHGICVCTDLASIFILLFLGIVAGLKPRSGERQFHSHPLLFLLLPAFSH